MSLDHEEQYFINELADKRKAVRFALEERAREAASRASLAGALSVDDEEVVERVRALGFDGDTGRIFDILPLIYVAWADGRIQAAERASILEVLRIREIAPGSEAWIFTEALLEQRPSQDYMELTLQLLKDVQASNHKQPTTILELCAAIANASGGFFGFTSAINDEENAALEKIAATLGVDTHSLDQLLDD